MGLRTTQNYNPNAPQDEENQPSQGGAAVPGGAPAPGGAAGAGQVTTKGPSKSGRFVNIQRYVQANRPGTQRLGQATTGQIGQQEQAAAGAQQQAQSAFGQAVERSRQGVTQAGAQQAVERIQQNPVALNEEQMSEAQKLYNINYGGPRQLNEIGEYGQALGASEKAKEVGELAQGEGGRYQLLRQQFAQPQYSRGQTALDTALLGSDLGVSQAVSQSGLAAKARGEALTGVEQAAGTQASSTAQELEDIRNRVQGTVGTETERTEGEVQAALQRLQEERGQLSPKLREALEKGEISQDLLAKTNLGDLTGQELYGASFGDMIGPELTKETVASKDEAARVNALKRIAGAEPGYKEDLAGSVDRSKQFKYDVDKIKQQVAERKGQYESASGAAQAEADRALRAGGWSGYHITRQGQEQDMSSLANKIASGQALSAEESARVQQAAQSTDEGVAMLGRELGRHTGFSTQGFASPAAKQSALAQLAGDAAARARATASYAAQEQAQMDAARQAALQRVQQQYGYGRQLRVV